MKDKILATFLSIVIGYAVFAAVLKVAGLENVLGAFKGISPVYLIPFAIVSLALFMASTWRWKSVLAGEHVNVPFLTLLRYQFVIFGINYLTPTARMGGEPLKVLLLRKQHIKSSRSFASIVIDNFIGRGFDAVIGGGLLIALVFASASFPEQTKGLFLAAGLALLGIVAASYLILVKKKSIFSYLLDVAGKLMRCGKSRVFRSLHEKASTAESNIREMLTKKPKSMILAVAFASLSWPLTLLQYKLALLMLGVDASLIQILLSVVVLSFTAFIPIPASLGVQEAGQFSAFKLLSANPHAGIALSLVLRLKDVMLLLVSFVLLSQEGISVFQLINKKIAGNASSMKEKEKRRRKK